MKINNLVVFFGDESSRKKNVRSVNAAQQDSVKFQINKLCQVVGEEHRLINPGFHIVVSVVSVVSVVRKKFIGQI